MLLKKQVLFLALFIGTCQYVVAQTNACALSLKGYVNTGILKASPLSGVSVSVDQLGNGVITDSSGYFSIPNLCAGKKEIKIRFTGYKTIDTFLLLNDSKSVNFALMPDTSQLANVTVSDVIIHKDQITTAVKTTLSGQALEETRGLSLGESLKGIAGVNSIQNGPNISKPVIHGVYSNRILIMNNGVRQEGQTWGNDHAPEIDPFIATKITVIKGAASIRYGSDAIGGVILLDPKDLPLQPGTNGEINLVGMTNGNIGVASGMLEGAGDKQLKGFSYRVQGTLKKAGNAEAPDYYIGNTGFGEDDYSATIAYNKPRYGTEIYYSRFDTKIGIASASHIGTIADLYEAIQRPEPAVPAHFTYSVVRPYQAVNHQLIKWTAYLNLNKSFGRIEATYAFQKDIRKEYDADVSFNDSIARLNPPDLYFKLNTTTVDLIWEHPAIKKKIVGSIGFNFITHGNIQQGTGYQELIPNFQDYGGGIFAIEKYEHKKLTLEAGVRYDYRWLQAYTINGTTLIENRPTYNWQNITANVGVIYKPTDEIALTYNFGTAWRPPQVIELFANGIHQSAASWENGDSSLKLEKSYNNNLNFIYRHKSFEVEADFYANYFNGYIYLRPDSTPRVTIQGAFPSFTYTQVKSALFTGVDFSFTYKLFTPLSFTSKMSIVRAKNLDNQTWLINIPADRFDNSLRYTFLLKKKVKNLFFGVSNLAVAKQTRVPPNSYIKDYAPPPAGYVLWGLETGCSLYVGKQHFDVSLSANNVTNVAYRDYLDRFRYFVYNPGRNIILRITMPLNFSKNK